ncbi:MAG: CaiB/BaiF CoA transferase family protein [Gammaproteobacteria bacterium]
MSTLLKGVKVIELGLILPGAALGNLLADQGAEVIKVEPPPNGDYIRYFPEQVGTVDGHSFWHLVLNRNKKSVAVDLRTDEGRAILHDLVRGADVFITNLIAGQPERLGAGYRALRAIKPDLVYCQVTGFGATGPYAILPSHGLAMASITGQCVLAPDARGWLRIVQDPAFGGGPQCAGQPVQTGPLWAAFGIANALYRRAVSGEGAYIDVSNCEATLATAWVGLPAALNPGRLNVAATSNSLESAKHAFYPTRDGKHVFVALLEPKFWAKFCKVVGRDDLLAGLETDVKAFDRLDPEMNEVHHRELMALFQTRTRDEWRDLFVAHDLPCSPVNTAAELGEDPQLRARGAFVDVEHPVAGSFRMAAEPLQVRGQPRPVPAPAPAPGQHTNDVLAGLGYSRERIGELERRGIVSSAKA